VLLEKYEIRISKSETNLKFECQNVQNSRNKTMRSDHKINQNSFIIARPRFGWARRRPVKGQPVWSRKRNFKKQIL